jgi:hypothetical protein
MRTVRAAQLLSVSVRRSVLRLEVFDHHTMLLFTTSASVPTAILKLDGLFLAGTSFTSGNGLDQRYQS